MKTITLSCGHVIRVSDEDADLLEDYRWRPLYGRGNPDRDRYPYADRGNRYKRRRLLHTAIAERIFGRLPERHERVDHINGDQTDCQRSNIRIVTHGRNNNNSTVARTALGIRGVHEIKNKPEGSYRYRATFTIDGVRVLDERFLTVQEAHVARMAAEIKHLGETAPCLRPKVQEGSTYAD